MRLVNWLQFKDQIDPSDYDSLVIQGAPIHFNEYNTADPANSALPEAALVKLRLSEDFGGAYADYDLTGVESIDLNTYDGGTMTVALADMVIPGSGTYTVLDTATAIQDEVTDISAGSLDDAISVATTDSDGVSPPDTLTLTVAEYGQLVDGDTTLTTPYRIVDTAANIQDAIADDGSSLGVIAGADSVESSDSNTLTFTVAEVKALNTGTVTIVGGYAVSDSGSNIALAFDNGDEGVLTGAVSVKTTSTATLTVAEFKSLLDAGNIDPTGGLYDIVDTVQVVDAGEINFSHAQIHKVYAQVDFFAAPEVVQDLTGLTNLATNADEIQVGPVEDVVLTVEQSDLAWVSSSSFRVVDTAAAIEAEVTRHQRRIARRRDQRRDHRR